MNSIFQDGAINADLVLNREQFEWWAFKDVNPPNISRFCGGLTGPMAIIVSEETPPRKLAMSFFSKINFHMSFVLPRNTLVSASDIVILLQRVFLVTHSASSAYGGFT